MLSQVRRIRIVVSCVLTKNRDFFGSKWLDIVSAGSGKAENSNDTQRHFEGYSRGEFERYEVSISY